MAPIRHGLEASGLVIDDWKGESYPGQMEMNVHYAEAMRMADDHILFKEAAKVIAWRQGCSLTFMPKYTDREGNSCHIHYSLWDDENPCSNVPARSSGGLPVLPGRSGSALRELCFLFAQNINSYNASPTACSRRLQRCGGRTTELAPCECWARVRACASSHGFLAATVIPTSPLRRYRDGSAWRRPITRAASALDGRGAGDDDQSRLPYNLVESLQWFEASDFARQAFGEEVVGHYAGGLE